MPIATDWSASPPVELWRRKVGPVAATPEGFEELARFPAIEGRIWNHPALVGNVVLVRNGQEMAAFRLPLAG